MPINANDEIPGGRPEVKPTLPVPQPGAAAAPLVKTGNQRQEMPLPLVANNARMDPRLARTVAGGTS